MPIFIGSDKNADFYIGSDKIAEIYIGSDLVYSGTKTLYPAAGATVTNLPANTGTYSTADFRTNINSGTNTNSTTLALPVDLTGINTLVVRGNFAVNNTRGYSGVWICSPSQYNDYAGYQRYPFYTIGQGSNNRYYTLMDRIRDTTGSVSEYTFDTSALTGTYYICIGCYFNSTNSGNAIADINEIVGFTN